MGLLLLYGERKAKASRNTDLTDPTDLKVYATPEFAFFSSFGQRLFWQLWSRYPAERTWLRAGATFRQRNAYLLIPWNRDGPAVVESERHRWTNPRERDFTIFSPHAHPSAGRALARPGETAATAGPKPEIWRALREVSDDQLYDADANIVDLG